LGTKVSIFAQAIYPSLVGLLLGVLQTGLYFQLAFTLSSGFGTYLLVTLCWLAGSAFGVLAAARLPVSTSVFLVVALAGYGVCSAMLLLAPFNTTLVPFYAILVLAAGVYPGVFFARAASVYKAGTLFFRENNGFIVGLALGTMLFMLLGRASLWLPPVFLAVCLLALHPPFRTVQTINALAENDDLP
jgi:hypothetical protein